MIDNLEIVKGIVEEHTNVRKELIATAKRGIRAELDDIFENNPDITNIMWSHKDSPYDDEGMREGVFGPAINQKIDDGDSMYSKYPEWVWGERITIDPRVKNLSMIIQTLGPEIMCEIFGDEHIVIATPDGEIETEGLWY